MTRSKYCGVLLFLVACYEGVPDDASDSPMVSELAADALPPIRVPPNAIGARYEESIECLGGETTPQYVKFEMVNKRVDLLAQAVAYFRNNPVCSSLKTKAEGKLGEALSRYAASETAYEARSTVPRRQPWLISPGGINASGHYNVAFPLSVAGQQCSIKVSINNNCATTISTELAEWFDIRVENGKCVKGSLTAAQPVCSYDDDLGDAGTIDGTKTDFPQRDAASLVALEHTHHLHHAVSDWVCDGKIGSPPAGNVQQAHMDYEALAADSDDASIFEEATFRKMHTFSGGIDPGWSLAEACAWKRLEDVFHAGANGDNPSLLPEYEGLDVSWNTAQQLGDWGFAQAASLGHRAAHTCMNYKGNVQTMFPCGVEPLEDGVASPSWVDCDKTTCSAFLYGEVEGVRRIEHLLANDPDRLAEVD